MSDTKVTKFTKIDGKNVPPRGKTMLVAEKSTGKGAVTAYQDGNGTWIAPGRGPLPFTPAYFSVPAAPDSGE